MKQIKIIESTSEIGAGTRGASLGAGALKVAAQHCNPGYFGHYERLEVAHENHRLHTPSQYHTAKHIDGMVSLYQSIADCVTHVLSQGHFPLVLAGDHSSAGGTIAGIKQQYPNKRLGVIWIDAHSDLHTPYTTFSGNMHGMPLATAIGTDNLKNKKNNPKPETIAFWEKLKLTGGITPKIRTEDLVFVAVRDVEKLEDALIEEHNIQNYTVEAVRRQGAETVAEAIKDRLQHCDLVYVSFDVDAMDCDLVSRGTGTPVENGLTPEEANTLMSIFAAWKKVACIEIAEINPCLDDKRNTMAETAFEILDHLTQQLEERFKYLLQRT